MKKLLVVILTLTMIVGVAVAGVLDGVYEGKTGMLQFCPDESMNGPIDIDGKVVVIHGNKIRIYYGDKVSEGILTNQRLDDGFDVWASVEGMDLMFSVVYVDGKKVFIITFKDSQGCVNSQAFGEKQAY